MGCCYQPIGIPGALSSRLIPVDNFRGTEAQESLLNALLTTANSSLGLQMYAVTPYSAPFSAKDVSATPAWRNSLLHVVTGAVWTWNTSIVDVRAKYKSVSASMDNLRAITPAGAYQVSECDYSSDTHLKSLSRTKPTCMSQTTKVRIIARNFNGWLTLSHSFILGC